MYATKGPSREFRGAPANAEEDLGSLGTSVSVLASELLGAKQTKRSRLLRAIHQLLSSEYRPDLLTCHFTLFSALIGAVEKASAFDSVLALQALCIALVTTGGTCASDSDYLRTNLRRLFTKSKHGSVREWAGFALGWLAFVCPTSLEEDLEWFFSYSTEEINFYENDDTFAEPESGLFNGAPASSEVSRAGHFLLVHHQALGLLKALVLLSTNWSRFVLGSWKVPPADIYLTFLAQCIKRRRLPDLSLYASYGFALLCDGFLEENSRPDSGSSLEVEQDGTAAAVKSRNTPCIVEAEKSNKSVRRIMEFLRDVCSSTLEKTTPGIILDKDTRKARRQIFRSVLQFAEEEIAPPSECIGLGGGAMATHIQKNELIANALFTDSDIADVAMTSLNKNSRRRERDTADKEQALERSKGRFLKAAALQNF